MRLRTLTLAAFVSATVADATHARAQSPSQAPPQPPPQLPRVLTIRADNDAFDFWQPPAIRSDEEYTSGAFLAWTGGDAPAWARRFAPSVIPCGPGVAHCRTRSTEIGQMMYTPRRTIAHPDPPPGSRMNAGWLYVADAARFIDGRRLNEVGVTLGVTGDESLAHFSQHALHELVPAFKRPVDWHRQIGFEPGIIARYAHVRWLGLGSAGALSFDAEPKIELEAGNVSTAAATDLHVRGGWRLPHPWIPAAADAPASITVTFGGFTRFVARDLFLDGNTFGPRDGVGHTPVVNTIDGTVSAQRGRYGFVFGVSSEGRTYRTGPAKHTWGTMSLSIALDK